MQEYVNNIVHITESHGYKMFILGMFIGFINAVALITFGALMALMCFH